MNEIKIDEKQRDDISKIIVFYYEDEEIRKAIMEVLSPEKREIWNKIEKMIQAHLNKKLDRKIKVLYNSGSGYGIEIPRRALYRLIKMNSSLVHRIKFEDWNNHNWAWHKSRTNEMKRYGDYWCWTGERHAGNYLFDEDGLYDCRVSNDIKLRAHPDLIKVFEELGERKFNAPANYNAMREWRYDNKRHGCTGYCGYISMKELVAGVDYDIRCDNDEFGGEYIDTTINVIDSKGE